MDAIVNQHQKSLTEVEEDKTNGSSSINGDPEKKRVLAKLFKLRVLLMLATCLLHWVQMNLTLKVVMDKWSDGIC